MILDLEIVEILVNDKQVKTAIRLLVKKERGLSERLKWSNKSSFQVSFNSGLKSL